MVHNCYVSSFHIATQIKLDYSNIQTMDILTSKRNEFY